MTRRLGTYDLATSSKGKTKKCLDCPAVIPAKGRRDRCGPCSDAWATKLKRLRGQKAQAKKLAERAARPPKPPRLGELDIGTLKLGLRHPDGVIAYPFADRYKNQERRMAKLVAMGLATPSPHGDWYITDAGRAAAKGGDNAQEG